MPSRTPGGDIIDIIRDADRMQRRLDTSIRRTYLPGGEGRGPIRFQKMDPVQRESSGRLGGGRGGGQPNATSGAHGLYVAAIFLQDLAADMSEEWLYELLANIGRDAQQRAMNKLGMYQPPENIMGYRFPGWEKLTEKYKTWKMSKVGMESPGIMRGLMQDSIRWYVVPAVLEVVVGSDMDYAEIFELGRGEVNPRPFLAPAVLEATGDWIRLAAKAGFLDETSITSEGSGKIISERFTQGTMSEAINKLKEAITGADLPGARKRKFLPALVERVYPGVSDWRWPTGASASDQQRLGMDAMHTGMVVGAIPERGSWKNYYQYMDMVREASHRNPEESMQEIPMEEMQSMREGPPDEDIDF